MVPLSEKTFGKRYKASRTYICEYGQTHGLTLQPGAENATSTLPRFGPQAFPSTWSAKIPLTLKG